jgi:hypothetical protein
MDPLTLLSVVAHLDTAPERWDVFRLIQKAKRKPRVRETNAANLYIWLPYQHNRWTCDWDTERHTILPPEYLPDEVYDAVKAANPGDAKISAYSGHYGLFYSTETAAYCALIDGLWVCSMLTRDLTAALKFYPLYHAPRRGFRATR